MKHFKKQATIVTLRMVSYTCLSMVGAAEEDTLDSTLAMSVDWDKVTAILFDGLMKL